MSSNTKVLARDVKPGMASRDRDGRAFFVVAVACQSDTTTKITFIATYVASHRPSIHTYNFYCDEAFFDEDEDLL
jgi:hypothetical protein